MREIDKARQAAARARGMRLSEQSMTDSSDAQRMRNALILLRVQFNTEMNDVAAQAVNEALTLPEESLARLFRIVRSA